MIQRVTKVSLCLVGIFVLSYGYMLWHGYFDHGRFAIEQSQVSPVGRIALVVKRSDSEALSSDDYFVLVESKTPTVAELKYHTSDVPFAAAINCVSVRWAGVAELVVSCRGGSIDSNHINVKHDRVGDVTIIYKNFGVPAQS